MGLHTSLGSENYQLHYFVDASKHAYGAVCYLRSSDINEHINCNLVINKSHLARKDKFSISRLELLAAVTAVKLNIFLKHELNLPRLRPAIFWTDSAVVLQSIRNEEKRFPLFLSRRLKFITKNTCISNWRYVPSELNPADVLSRGCKSDKRMKTKSWLSGPEFLSEFPDSWPCRFGKTTLDVENVKAFDKKATSAFLITEMIDPVDKLIAYFSSWFKLKKATAWLLKLKTFLINSNSVYHFSRSLSVSDLQKAEIELIRYEEWNNCFIDIMSKMQINESFSLPSKSPLLKLNPVIVNGLLRVGGRLDRASVSFDLKHSIILPHTSHLTNLIVLHCHCITGHGGANMTLNQTTTLLDFTKYSRCS